MSPAEYGPDPWQVHKPARRAQVAVEFADGSWTLTTLVGAALRPEVTVGLEQGTGRRVGLTFAGVDDYRVHQGADLSGLPRAEGDAAAWSERYLEGAPEPPEVFPARHPDGPDPARVEHVRMWLDPDHGWPEGLGWPIVVAAGTEGFEGLARLWTGSTGQRLGQPFRVTRAGWDGVTRYLDLHLEPEPEATPDPEPVEASRGVESLRMALQRSLADHATAASTGPVFGTMAVGFRPQTLSVPEVRYLLSLLPPPPLPTEPGSRILITRGANGGALDHPRVAMRANDDRLGQSAALRWVDVQGVWWREEDITRWQPVGDD